MLSKKLVQLVNALKIKKYREIHKQFIVEGKKSVNELLHSSLRITHLYYTTEWKDNYKINQKKDCHVVQVNTNELNKISALKTPDCVLAVADIPSYELEINALNEKWTLLLDRIKDPGNLGTIIRLADWFGIKDVICSTNSVDAYNPKVVQASMGSIFRIRIHYTHLPDLLNECKKLTDCTVYGSFMKGENIYNMDVKSRGLIILGNESEGITDELLPFIDRKISIPSFSPADKGPDSLNISMAAAVICSEIKRRKA